MEGDTKKEAFLHKLRGKKLTYKRYTKALEKIKNFNTNNLKVEQASFEAVFEKYPTDFFYCDPPRSKNH